VYADLPASNFARRPIQPAAALVAAELFVRNIAGSQAILLAAS